MPKLRVINYIVNVEAVSDDGEHLTAIQTQPQVVPAASWEAFVSGGLDRALVGLQEQLDQQAPSGEQ